MSENTSQSANRLLAALPESEYQRLKPHLFPVSLASGTILYNPTEKIDTLYLPENALVSLVHTLKDGATTEITLVGSRGMVGLAYILGNRNSQHLTIVQAPGNALKISALILQQEFNRAETLQRLLFSCIVTRLDEISQLAVCNRHHTIEERLARWLLMVRDLIQSDTLPLTQEFMGNMLGVRRPGVTLTASAFQRAGLIRYSRGKIVVLDREALEDVSCECYQLFHHNFYRGY